MMKPNDNLEQRLQELPVRPLPPAWREEILGAVREVAADRATRPEAGMLPWWHAWLWPCPQAWAGIAAVWCAIFVLNLMGRESKGGVANARVAAPSPSQVQMAFDEQRRLLAEMDWLPQAKPAPAPLVPRPRSCRRPEQFAV